MIERPTEARTVQERLRAEAELIAMGHQEPMYLPGTAAHETDQWKAADRIDALTKPFEDVMDGDWSALDHLLGHSGMGQFWRGVFKEIRTALTPQGADMTAKIIPVRFGHPHLHSSKQEVPKQKDERITLLGVLVILLAAVVGMIIGSAMS